MLGHSNIIVIRRLAAMGLAAALTVGAAPAYAQQLSVSYPPSRALNDIAAWLLHDTPLTLSQVVDVGPSAVTAVTTAAPMGETRGFLANLSSEALDPAVISHDGIASWSIPVEIECEHRQARLGAMTGYRSRNLQSEPRIIRNADTAWVSPADSSPLGSAIRALCDRDFPRPLVGQVIAASRIPERKPGPPPIIEVRPKRVAKSDAKPDAAASNSSDPAPAGPTALAASGAPSPPLSIPIPDSKTPSEPMAAPKFKPPAGGGSHAVQIGASPTPTDIQSLLARFKNKFSADLGGLSADLVTAQVDGKTVNRAIVSGFVSASEAGAFCKRLANANQACFIRR